MTMEREVTEVESNGRFNDQEEAGEDAGRRVEDGRVFAGRWKGEKEPLDVFFKGVCLKKKKKKKKGGLMEEVDMYKSDNGEGQRTFALGKAEEE